MPAGLNPALPIAAFGKLAKPLGRHLGAVPLDVQGLANVRKGLVLHVSPPHSKQCENDPSKRKYSRFFIYSTAECALPQRLLGASEACPPGPKACLRCRSH